ncbi:MAG: PH domain-containing protein [Clostridia bacterium]
MLDFQNATFLKLKPVPEENYAKLIGEILTEGERIVAAFQSIRDGVVFTNKRVISINVQGATGKKKDFTSLAYKKVQTFSIETAGVFDLDSELEMWFSGLGKVTFEFTAKADVAGLCRMISAFIL